MNEKLEAIATKASADLAVLIKEGEEKILEAWDAAVAEAQDNETKPKFKLAFAIDLDLDADVMSTKLSWGIKHTLTVNATIPDPNQTSLPLENSQGRDEADERFAKKANRFIKGIVLKKSRE